MYMYIHTYTYMYVHVQAYIYICTCTRIHIHMNMYIKHIPKDLAIAMLSRNPIKGATTIPTPIFCR